MARGRKKISIESLDEKIEQQKKEAGITEPANLEEQAISLVGKDIYEKLIKGYTEGTHLEDPKFAKYIEYRRGKKIEIDAPEGFIYSFDGELIPQNHFTVEVVPNAIRFAVPKSAVYLPGVKHVPKYAEEKEIVNVP